MSVLRPVEERDSKGGTLRINPTVVYKQSQDIRTIVGRNDYKIEPNPLWHQPITAQVQDAQIRFFQGLPDTAQTRKLAKEVQVKDVPKYIIDELKSHPMKVREQRPMVYEVKVVTIGDQEVTRVEEIYSQDGLSVTVTPSAPDSSPEAVTAQKRRRSRGVVAETAEASE